MLKSFETRTDQVSTCEASTQFEEDDLQTTVTKVEDITEEDNAETVSPGVSPQKDPAYQPSSPPDKFSDGFNTSEDEEEENCKPLNPQDDTKFIFLRKSCLNFSSDALNLVQLTIKKHQSTRETQLFVTLPRVNDHKTFWKSQPMLEGMAAGNLLMSSSILLSGSSCNKVASLADILKLKFFSEKTFYNIQDQYLLPVIYEFWEQEQQSVFAEFNNKDLWLSGDGRCDNPGHNAKYGKRTMIDQDTDNIGDKGGGGG